MPTTCSEHAPSGKRVTLPPLPPLRTGRDCLQSSGSSTSRTPRLLLLILLCLSSESARSSQQFLVAVLLAVAHRSLRHGMTVLMAEQVNQDEVAVAILAPLRPCSKVVNVEFFVIEEGLSTFRASALLSLGQLLF